MPVHSIQRSQQYCHKNNIANNVHITHISHSCSVVFARDMGKTLDECIRHSYFDIITIIWLNGLQFYCVEMRSIHLILIFDRIRLLFDQWTCQTKHKMFCTNAMQTVHIIIIIMESWSRRMKETRSNIGQPSLADEITCIDIYG